MYCIFFVIGLVGLCCKPQLLVIIIIIIITAKRREVKEGGEGKGRGRVPPVITVSHRIY